MISVRLLFFILFMSSHRHIRKNVSKLCNNTCVRYINGDEDSIYTYIQPSVWACPNRFISHIQMVSESMMEDAQRNKN